MTNIVVWSAFSTSPETVAARFPDDRVLAIGDEKGLAAAADAEVAFSGNNPRRVRQLLDATPKLRWYHTVSAGVENMPLPELAQRGIVLTNNSGSYDIQIAEHLLAFVFAASRQLHRYRDSQRVSEWKEQRHQELRGAIVDEPAMIEALQAKRIGGAALDVFTTEPLPKESPLWTLENVIVTPHHSGSSPRAGERTLALFAENLRRYKSGEPLINRVDFEAGY